MSRIPLLLTILALAACNQVPTKPQVIEVPGPITYVPIDPKLTFHPPLPPLVSSNPLECPAVAQTRLDLLGDAYRQLDSIRAVQGTSVP